MKKLEFLDPRDAVSGYLSNFFRAPFWLDGVHWPTVEHAYQAAKFADPEYAQSIRNAATARAAKTLGQTRDIPLRPNWDACKQHLMLRLVAAKFCLNGNAVLMARFLETKDQLLVEASPNDSYRVDFGGQCATAISDAYFFPHAWWQGAPGCSGGPMTFATYRRLLFTLGPSLKDSPSCPCNI